MLALQLLKHQDELNQRGFYVELESCDNLLADTLIITNNRIGHFYHTYTLVIEHRPWERYREFSLFINPPTRKYYYRLSPVNGEPIEVKPHLTSQFFWTNNQIIPDDLINFGNQTLQLLEELNDKLASDKLYLDSSDT